MMDNIFSLNGRNILVTGASGGIGRSVALQCSVSGANVFLNGRDTGKLRATLEVLTPGDHMILPADITKDEDIEMLTEKVSELDGIVLNAGIVKTVPVQFINKESLDLIFQTNILSSITLIQKLIKKKKVREGSSICFVSSVSSQLAQFGNSIYSATKGAVNSFARALALELAPKKTRVNAVLPGYVETGILKNSPISRENLEEHKKNFPLGRFGKPEDVSYLIVYLLSDASEWMTGTLITIDGGYSIK